MDPKDYVVVIIIVLIALAAGILSAYQYVESANKDKEDKEMANKLVNAQDNALKASLELKNAQQQTIKLMNLLRLKRRLMSYKMKH